MMITSYARAFFCIWLVFTTLATTEAAGHSERYIVKFKNNQFTNYSSRLSKKYLKAHRYFKHHSSLVVDMTPEQLKSLALDPAIQRIEKDPKRFLLAESVPYGITMTQADTIQPVSGSNIKVCLIDSGYSLGHEDLIDSNITGDDGYEGFDSGNWYEDGQGHGTHVAGIVSAIGGNDIGVRGINSDQNISLHIVKVFNDDAEWVYGSDLVAAVDQCIMAGVNVINMSLGGGAPSALEEAAFASAYSNNVLSVAAAGNDGNSNLFYPAAYESVISVAAVDDQKNIANFSQRNQQVEISAPGVDILSTFPGNAYSEMSGTSMAAPHVSGVAALIWNQYPGCSALQIRQALNASAEDLGTTGWDSSYGYGIVQAATMFDLLETGCNGTGGPSGPPPLQVTELSNGVTQAPINAIAGETRLYSLNVTEDSADLQFTLTGGTGDADLYVKFGSQPSLQDFDCRSYNTGNDERCIFDPPSAGTYYVTVNAYTDFSNVSLVGLYNEESTTPPHTDIDLTSEVKWKKGHAIVKLNWSGADARRVSIYRDGVLLRKTLNDGKARDKVGPNPNAQYQYKVCEINNGDCSSDITVHVPVVTVNLSTKVRWKKGNPLVKLFWDGAETDRVHIFQDGRLVKKTRNDGKAQHKISGDHSGQYQYQVCESNGRACSDKVTAVLD